MWTCPNCNRQFKNKNQDHSCMVTPIESHFFNKEPGVKATFEKLSHEVSNFGPMTVNSVKHAILFTRGSHFLAVKPKRNWLDIEFVLPYPVEEFPIYKTVQASKYKWAHFIRLEAKSEVDELLHRWLKEAYELSK
jgi:hypothetical protein